MSHLGIIYGNIKWGERNDNGHSSQVTNNIGREEQSATAGFTRQGTDLSRRSVITGVGALSVTGLAGCLGGESDEGGGSGGSESESDESQIRSVLQKQVTTMENGDVEGYMETMHPDSPTYDNTQETLEQLVAEYNFEVDLEINSVEVDGDTATAEVTQETRTEDSNPDFQDNRLEATHELQTHEDEWRFYDTISADVEEL